jgi:maltodextrin utilization protein YvdJ
MAKTLKNRQNKKTLTNKSIPTNRSLLTNFQKEVTVIFLQMLLMIKLYHWKTYSYATHKATDDLYSKLNENTDKFIEILLGKSGNRTDLTNQKSIKLIDLTSPEALKREIEAFKGYLVSLNDNKTMKLMSNTDLYNIRDEILGNLNQFLYLLTFK